MAGERELPGWLGRLMRGTFFVPCGTHEGWWKNDKNIFCLRCRTSICQNCAPDHPSHPLLQVIFLKPRSTTKSSSTGSANFCLTCYRILQEPFCYCCITCKAKHMEFQGIDISTILFRFDESSEFTFDDQFESLEMEDEAVEREQIMPCSAMKDRRESTSKSSANEKSKSGTKSTNYRSPNSRRKGTPHRSPLS